MYLQSHSATVAQRSPQPAGPRAAWQPGDIVLRRLRSAAEIASVLHLRDEIDLSVHTQAGIDRFVSLEKKETSAASWSRSTSAGSGSERSASSRSATGSP